MAESADLSTIFEFFFAHLAEDQAFLGASKPSKNDRLGQLLRGILKIIVADGAPTPMHWLEVPEHHLWHGGFLLLPDAAVQALYFADLNRGLCTVCRLSGGPVHFLRFSMPGFHADLTSMKLVSTSLRSDGGVN